MMGRLVREVETKMMIDPIRRMENTSWKTTTDMGYSDSIHGMLFAQCKIQYSGGENKRGASWPKIG